MNDTIPAFPGADALAEWFGYWPSFHDAEIHELHLDRKGTSWLKVHTWEMMDRVDDKGFYVSEKHIIVSFSMEKIADLALEDFSPQNVISSLEIKQVSDGFEMTLDPCYGLWGFIKAAKMWVDFVPHDAFQGPFA